MSEYDGDTVAVCKSYVDDQNKFKALEDNFWALRQEADTQQTLIGRIALGWFLVMVPSFKADDAKEWCALQKVNKLWCNAYEFDGTGGHDNAVAFVLEDKEKATLLKMLFT